MTLNTQNSGINALEVFRRRINKAYQKYGNPIKRVISGNIESDSNDEQVTSFGLLEGDLAELPGYIIGNSINTEEAHGNISNAIKMSLETGTLLSQLDLEEDNQ